MGGGEASSVKLKKRRSLQDVIRRLKKKEG